MIFIFLYTSNFGKSWSVRWPESQSWLGPIRLEVNIGTKSGPDQAHYVHPLQPGQNCLMMPSSNILNSWSSWPRPERVLINQTFLKIDIFYIHSSSTNLKSIKSTKMILVASKNRWHAQSFLEMITISLSSCTKADESWYWSVQFWKSSGMHRFWNSYQNNWEKSEEN